MQMVRATCYGDHSLSLQNILSLNSANLYEVLVLTEFIGGAVMASELNISEKLTISVEFRNGRTRR